MSNYITTDTELQSIAQAIRTKAGTVGTIEYPEGFVTAIGNIPSGGGIDPIHMITSNATYFDYEGRLDNLIEQYGASYITTEKITNIESMFEKTSLEEIPFDINVKSSTANFICSKAFYYAKNLKHIPLIIPNDNSVVFNGANDMFHGCNNLEDVNFLANVTSTITDRPQLARMFADCHKLKSIPTSFLKLPSATSYTAWIGVGGFVGCRSLSKINNVYPPNAKYTSSSTNAVSYCCMLSSFTFDTDNGTPYVREWSRQSLGFHEFSSTFGGLGYFGPNYGPSSAYYWAQQNLDPTKEVTDATSYQALKDDPEYWTALIEYSHYNHDSAVETINSLPDCSSGQYANNLIFNGTMGSLTDGGAISNLTASEIAVATAKNWTVTIQ